jgi:hypothetical protein
VLTEILFLGGKTRRFIRHLFIRGNSNYQFSINMGSQLMDANRWIDWSYRASKVILLLDVEGKANSSTGRDILR